VKGLSPEPKTTCMWMGLTCLPPPRLAEKGKGDPRGGEKERNWFGSTPETLLLLFIIFLERAREKLWWCRKLQIKRQRGSAEQKPCSRRHPKKNATS
jgi:hypothetical protein